MSCPACRSYARASSSRVIGAAIAAGVSSRSFVASGLALSRKTADRGIRLPPFGRQQQKARLAAGPRPLPPRPSAIGVISLSAGKGDSMPCDFDAH